MKLEYTNHLLIDDPVVRKKNFGTGGYCTDWLS